MKKVLLSLIIFCSISSFAQKGLQVGVSGKVLTSLIVNQNVWGLGTNYDCVFTSGSGGGLDIGYNFTKNLGLYTGIGTVKLGQKYSTEINNNKMERELKLKYNIIPVMLKFNGVNEGVNFICGIGIEYAIANDVSQTWTKDGEPYYQAGVNPITNEEFAYSAPDVTDRFESSDIFGVFEIGVRIPIIEQLYINTTINACYGLKDINHEDWKIEDSDRNYNPSHNAYGAFKVGISYLVFGE